MPVGESCAQGGAVGCEGPREVASIPGGGPAAPCAAEALRSRTCVRRLAAVEVQLTPEGIERLRRSVAMLVRGQPALDREAAITVMEELLRLQHGLRAVLAQIEELLGNARAH